MPDASDARNEPAPSRAPSRASANTNAFWGLMHRWSVPDEQALELIGFSGKIGKSGKRPRFRLSTSQVKTLEWLLEIDRAVGATHGNAAAWLRRRARWAPMNGRTPIEAMIEDGEATITAALQQLNCEVMRKALKQLSNSGK